MNKEKEKLAKAEKNLIYSQSDNKDFFRLCKRPIHNVHVHITILVKGVNLKNVFEAEKLLREAGITFDTRYGCGGRDWEFDYSLKGAYVKLRKRLNKEEQICNMLYRILYNGYSLEPEYLPCSILFKEYGRYYIIVYGKCEIFEKVLEKKLKKEFNDFKVITNLNCKVKAINDNETDDNEEKEDEEVIAYRCGNVSIKACYTQNKGGW